jgi:energy-coupling factor transporter ATP-binding protein EcfA2
MSFKEQTELDKLSLTDKSDEAELKSFTQRDLNKAQLNHNDGNQDIISQNMIEVHKMINNHKHEKGAIATSDSSIHDIIKNHIHSVKVLIICGPSGSGKSTLEKYLIDEYPEMFHKLQQVSTRKMRPNETYGNPYVFLSRRTFEFMKDRLIGRLGLSKDSLFKDNYGSIPDFHEFKINTLILAEEAIIDYNHSDVIRDFEIRTKSKVDTFILGLDTDYDNITSEEKAIRMERDEKFFAKEKSVLTHADHIFANVNGKYIDPKTLIKVLVEKSFING